MEEAVIALLAAIVGGVLTLAGTLFVELRRDRVGNSAQGGSSPASWSGPPSSSRS